MRVQPSSQNFSAICLLLSHLRTISSTLGQEIDDEELDSELLLELWELLLEL